MAESFVRRMLNRQRKRALAIILNHVERTFLDRLSPDEWTDFRKAVLGAISTYHDACIDMVESSVSDGMMLNEEAVRIVAVFNENVQTYRDGLREVRAVDG
jgi:hypothetical protein